VQAWAALRVYENDRRWNGGTGDTVFLKRVFHKMLLNFTWWVNRKDRQGMNIFQGGFLGLDNVGIFNRSAPLPGDGYIEQSDGTAWMAMFCLNMLDIALELSRHDQVYEDMASKFFEHLLYIAEAMTGRGTTGSGLWDDTDNFYYDKLCMPDGSSFPMRIRSVVGLIPLFAVAVVDGALIGRLQAFGERLRYMREQRSDLAALISRWDSANAEGQHLLSLARVFRMTKVLERMLDESEFLSPHGVRSVSRYYLDHPYEFDYDGMKYCLKYTVAESDSGLYGGNSNWRGPIWLPINFLLVESLRRFHTFYGDTFRIECPVGSGQRCTLAEVADDLARRLIGLFRRGQGGTRPVFDGCDLLQKDPLFRDLILFHEYFDGDTGRGLGASHQTGWTGLVANLIDQLTPDRARTR
jgi:hypothetical protein